MLSERAIGDLQELYAKVHRKITDGRASEAIEVCETIVKTTDALGEELTLTHYPTCEPCDGTAEIGSPAESDRKVRCQDMAYRTGKPGECRGNRYGRMSPGQLHEYVLMLATPKVDRASDTINPDAVPPIHDSIEMQRVPPYPPYVYDRDAVIAFNTVQGDLLRPIPVPEDDEEVLAHADGTYTVRKKNGE